MATDLRKRLGRRALAAYSTRGRQFAVDSAFGFGLALILDHVMGAPPWYLLAAGLALGVVLGFASPGPAKVQARLAELRAEEPNRG